MRVAVVSTGRGWHADELQRALEARGHRFTLLPVRGMVAEVGRQSRVASRNTVLDDFDVVIVRIIPRGSLEQTIFRMDAFHLLEARGTHVINPAGAIERTVDKYYASGLLAQAGVPTPRTIVCEHSDDALEAFSALGGDVVVKPLFGSMGLGLVRIESEDLAYRVFKALEMERAVYYVQEFIPHDGRDVRAFVLGGRLLAAMERQSDGWRTNVARGGRARAVRLTPAQEALCIRAARVMDAEYAGVDLLVAPGGEPYVLEVNGVPGWKGLQTTTEIDIADEIVAYLEHTHAGQRPNDGQPALAGAGYA